MNKNFSVVLCLALCCAGLALAQDAPTKVGVINVQSAVISTAEGKVAVDKLNTEYIEPKSKELDALRAEIAQLQDERQKGANTMSDDRLTELSRSIDQKTRDLTRAQEDAQTEMQDRQNTLFQPIAQKMMVIINKYANDQSYGLILDVSNPDIPIVFAANGIEITNDIIRLYDEQNPVQAAAAAPAAATPAAGQ